VTYRKPALIALVAALLVWAAPAPADPPGRAAWPAANWGSVDATPYLVGDGVYDNTRQLQSLVDFVRPDLPTGKGVTIEVPAGVFRVSSLLVDRDNVRVRGKGEGATVFVADPGQYPFVFGVRRVEKAGKSVTTLHRPDAFGTLDASLAAAAGRYWGFRTRGEIYGLAFAHGASVGQRDPDFPGSQAYDYWGKTHGFTLDLCYSTQLAGSPATYALPDGKVLAAVGSTTDLQNSGLYALYYMNGGPTFAFVSVDPADPDRVGTVHQFPIPLAGAPPPYRLSVWVDFDLGTAGYRLNGTAGTVVISPGLAPGRRFKPNEAALPFQFANSGIAGTWTAYTPPDVTFWAARASRVARKTAAANDLGRYGADADAVFWTPGTMAEGPSRLMDFSNGPACDGFMGKMFLIQADGLGGVSGNGLENCSVLGGASAVSVGLCLDPKVHHVEAKGWFQGLASAPYGPSYTGSFAFVKATGGDAAFSFSYLLCNISNSIIDRTGVTGLRSVAGSVTLTDSAVYGVGAGTRFVAYLKSGDYGGLYSVRSLMVDNEAQELGRSVIYCQANPYNPTLLDVTNVSVAGLSAAGYPVELVGNYDPASPRNALATVDLLSAGPGSGGNWAHALKVTGDAWKVNARIAAQAAAPAQLTPGPSTKNSVVNLTVVTPGPP
jgi:hypothetical protein